MLINHPLLGLRDSCEFYVLGSAELLNRPDWQSPDADRLFYDYIYLRENPYGVHKELWYHLDGDRSWLVVTRDTVTHEIYNVELASKIVQMRNNDASQQSDEASE